MVTESDISHDFNQVTFVKLECAGQRTIMRVMHKRFRTALIWHVDKYKPNIAEMGRQTGVTRDAINKILKREDATTGVENAIVIAAFFGKKLDEFLRMDEEPSSAIPALTELLTEDEERLIEAQVRGILAARAAQLSE